MIYRLLYGLATGTHCNYYTLCIGRTVVIEGAVIFAGDLIDLFHVIGNHIGQLSIEAAYGFSCLKICVRIKNGTSYYRMIGVKRPMAELIYSIPIHELCQIFIIQNIYLLNLMGGSKAVEEMHKRNAALDSGKVCYRRKVHCVLNRRRRYKRKTSLPSGHNVLMIAKDRERAGGYSPCRNMEYGRQQLTCHLIHVWYHQQQSLGSGESGCQCSALQGAVYRTGRTAFTLELHDLNRLTKQVLFALSGPHVYGLRHGRRRGNRIYCGDLTERICNMCSCGIAVHCFLN